MNYQKETGVRGSSLRSTNTIFIVEEDSSTRSMLIESILQESSYYPVLLTDGFQALKLTMHIKPSLFLIDYYLPKMNGIELYDHLHEREELRDVPAIIIDACLNDHRQAIEKRGLVAISKPFDVNELLTTIHEVLARVPERTAWYHQTGL